MSKPSEPYKRSSIVFVRLPSLFKGRSIKIEFIDELKFPLNSIGTRLSFVTHIYIHIIKKKMHGVHRRFIVLQRKFLHDKQKNEN